MSRRRGDDPLGMLAGLRAIAATPRLNTYAVCRSDRTGIYSIHKPACPVVRRLSPFFMQHKTVDGAVRECIAIEAEKGDVIREPLKWVKVCKCAKGAK